MNNPMTLGHCVPLQAAPVSALGSNVANVHAICSHMVQLDVQSCRKESHLRKVYKQTRRKKTGQSRKKRKLKMKGKTGK